jgi:hypothetical protein
MFVRLFSIHRNVTEGTTMAENEAQAHRDWMVQLLRKLQSENGLSRVQAMKLVLAMADREKLHNWLAEDLGKAPPEERAKFVSKVMALADTDEDDDDDDD